MQLYAYPVIFLFFACLKGCVTVENRRGYAEAFIYKGYGGLQCCKMADCSDLSEVA